MKAVVGRLTVLATLLIIGCGGGPPQAKAPEAQTGAGGEQGLTQATGTPDLTPVQAPENLVAFGRLGNPGGAVDTVAGWAKLPVDFRRLIQQNEPELGRLLVYEAPIEFAVALDPRATGDVPQPFAVFSVGLGSVEGAVQFAKHQGQSVRMVRPGVYRVSKRSDGPACAVAAALGKAPARLVCGERDDDVDALLPYATRGLPNENMGSADLHMELRAAPLRRLYGNQLRKMKTVMMPFLLRELSLDSPRFDRALADAAHGLADEILSLSEDIDSVSVDSWLKKDAGMIESKAVLRFKGSGSWTVQTVLDAASRGKGVPASFWKLPKDSELGSFGFGANPKRYDAMKKTIGELVDGLLEHEKMPRRLRDQIADVLQDTFTTEGGVVYGHGEVAGDPAEANAWKGSGLGLRERIRSQLGWYVVGVEEKAPKYKGYFDKIVKLYNDAQLRQLLDKRMHVKAADLPKLRARGARGLPPGSTMYEISLPSAFFGKMDFEPPMPPGARAPKPKAVPALSIVLAVVPDGDHTWLGLSADEKTLVARLADTRKAETTLAARDGLTPLKTSSSVSGGFFTLENLVKSVLTSLDSLHKAQKVERVFSSMPNHGQTPMIAWTSVERSGTTNLTWTVQVPRAVIEDIAAVAPALAAGGMGGPPPPMPPHPPMAPPSRPLPRKK
jgi:hypothetical protein